MRKLYAKLLRHFGPQGWWPIKNGGGAFEIMVGAILTQNTAWGNVERALVRLRQARALRPDAIVRMPTRRLEQLIRPAGYFRQKTKKLKILAHWIASSSDSSQRRKKTDALRRELLSLWGIGPETADSILLYALNRPVFVVDAYTKRLCAAHGHHFKNYDACQQFFASRLHPRQYNEMHALIVAWGKLYRTDKKSALRIIRR